MSWNKLPSNLKAAGIALPAGNDFEGRPSDPGAAVLRAFKIINASKTARVWVVEENGVLLVGVEDIAEVVG